MLELLQSGIMDCSFALFAQCLGRGGGRGNGSSMSVSWSSPVSVLDATEVWFPRDQRNLSTTKINQKLIKKKSPGWEKIRRKQSKSKKDKNFFTAV